MGDSDIGATGGVVSGTMCNASMETTSTDDMPVRPTRRSLVHFDTKDSVYEAFSTSLDEPARMVRSHSDSDMASHPIDIEYQEDEDVKKHFIAYIGLLREGFTYSVKVRLPVEHTEKLLTLYHRTHVLEDPRQLKSTSLDIETTDEGTSLVVSCQIFLTSGISGMFTDKVTFTGDNSSKEKLFQLTLNAQVLRAEQGKPSLRDGVKCLGLSPVDKSTESDCDSEANEEDDAICSDP